MVALALAVELVPLMVLGAFISVVTSAAFFGEQDRADRLAGVKLSSLLILASACWLLFFLLARCTHIAVRIIGTAISGSAVIGSSWILLSQLTARPSTTASTDTTGGDGSGAWEFVFLMVALGAVGAIARVTGHLTSLASRVVATMPAILIAATSAYYLVISDGIAQGRVVVLGSFLAFATTLIVFMLATRVVDHRPAQGEHAAHKVPVVEP